LYFVVLPEPLLPRIECAAVRGPVGPPVALAGSREAVCAALARFLRTVPIFLSSSRPNSITSLAYEVDHCLWQLIVAYTSNPRDHRHLVHLRLSWLRKPSNAHGPSQQQFSLPLSSTQIHRQLTPHSPLPSARRLANFPTYLTTFTSLTTTLPLSLSIPLTPLSQPRASHPDHQNYFPEKPLHLQLQTTTAKMQIFVKTRKY
jgi:hypothetical protein